MNEPEKKQGFLTRIVANLKQRRSLSALLVIFASIAFYMLLSNIPAVRKFFGGIFTVLAPFIGGLIIAFLLNPLIVFLERRVFRFMKHRAAHIISTVITFLIALGLIALILYALVPQLISSVSMLYMNLDKYFSSLKELLGGWAAGLDMQLDINSLIGSWSDAIGSATKWINENIDGILGAGKKVGSGIVSAFLALTLSIYIQLDKDNILRGIRRWSLSRMSTDVFTRVNEISQKSNRVFTSYLGGSLIDALIIGTANFIFMIILGMPYPLLISVVVGVTNLIPTFGPIIGGAIGAIIIFLVEPIDALWFLIFTVAIQLIDAYVIKPLIFRDGTGLRPLWVLVAVIIGGGLFGILGMLLGIPVLAIISWLIEQNVTKRLAEKGLDNEGRPIGEAPEPETPPKKHILKKKLMHKAAKSEANLSDKTE